jgi:hypothetical protein
MTEPTRDLAWHKGKHAWDTHDGYPRHQHAMNGTLTIVSDDSSPHFEGGRPFDSPKSKANPPPMPRNLREREVERIRRMCDELGAVRTAYRVELEDGLRVLTRLAGRIERGEVK